VTADKRGSLPLHAVARSALTLTGAAAAVQVLGIVRELFLAAQVGASSQLDALLVALLLPTTLAGVISGGTRIALVPAYLEARSVGGALDARTLAGTVLVFVGFAGVILSLVLEIFSSTAIGIAGPGLSETSRQSAIEYLHLVAPIGFIAAVTTVMFAILQAEERFATIAIAGFMGIATTLVLMLVLWERLGLWALAVGSLIGPIARRSCRSPFRVEIDDSGGWFGTQRPSP
jgi:putative peptidoglycan lipid II flippase